LQFGQDRHGIHDHLEALRHHGFGVAYRMLGSVTEAEDVAQEALVRFLGQESSIDVPAAWITTVATRLSINVLNSARVRRESYVGPWLPEPLLEDPAPDPASHAERAGSLSVALLVLLERLTPVQRAAYLLHEVFGYRYAEIGEIIERSEANSRQLVTRARTYLEAARPRFDVDRAEHDALLERFLAAAEQGELAASEALLAEDAVLYADGGGKAMAPPEPLTGAALIARFMVGVTRARRAAGGFEAHLVSVNGQLGRVLRRAGRAIWAGPTDGGGAGTGATEGQAQRQRSARRVHVQRPGLRRPIPAPSYRRRPRGPGVGSPHRRHRRGTDSGGLHRAKPRQARPSPAGGNFSYHQSLFGPQQPLIAFTAHHS
jgi:RNA polymerase sigma-70 factor (ECF subfamily)